MNDLTQATDQQLLSPGELSLLLYLETCAVDKGGRVKTQHMNNDDMLTARMGRLWFRVVRSRVRGRLQPIRLSLVLP